MRKWFSILFALCLVLSLVGCSSSKTEAAKSNADEMKSIHFELLPEDADLSKAPGVVVEPKKAPYNLGGWTAGSIVSWKVELPEDGQYAYNITYSRPGQYPKGWGILRTETADGGTHDLNFCVDPTGKSKDNEDWTVYTTHPGIGNIFTAGTARISVIPNFERGGDMPEYFINLRSIAITYTPKKVHSAENESKEETPGSEDEPKALENVYKIIIDGENVTGNMALSIQNCDLYAEAASYFDALTYNGNPILYSEYDKIKGAVGVYSWATDVMIMRFHVGTNLGYKLIDGVNDEWEEIRLNASIYDDPENNALLPVKAMTEYLTSSGKLVATVQE